MLWQKAERRLGLEGLVEKLSAAKTQDATAIALEVSDRRAKARQPAELVRAWENDSFVVPSSVDLRELRVVEDLALSAAHAFEAVQLSPVAPLGSCTVYGTQSQNRVLSAGRNLEVLADPTNLMALEVAARRRRGEKGLQRLVTVCRPVRTQRVDIPGYAQHFGIAAMVSAGRHKDSRVFAEEAFLEHIAVHQDFQRRAFAGTVVEPCVKTVVLGTSATESIAARIAERLLTQARGDGRGDSHVVETDLYEGGYYDGLRFQIWCRLPGEDGNKSRLEPLCDGGLVDWLRVLCSDRKEQLVISGVGIELAAKLRTADGLKNK